jgi:RimJ/RimL family protein N-acetyltransferase
LARFPTTLDAAPLQLVAWDPRYAAGVADASNASFDALHTWMSWATELATEASMLTVLAHGAQRFAHDLEWQYLMTEADGTVVGGTGLRPLPDPKSLEIGYWVRTDRTQRGYATASARALTSAAFSFLATCERVEIHMDVANLKSAAVPPRVGYWLEREEDRPFLAPGHTGRGFIWVMDRATWSANS